MRGKDLIAATLFGGAGGSGGSVAVSPKEVNFYDYDGTLRYAYTVEEAQKLSALPAGPEHEGLVFQGWNWSLEGVKGLTRAMNIGAMYITDDGTTRLYITLQEGRTSPMLGVGVNGTVTVDWGDDTEPDVLTGTSTSTIKWTPNHAYAAPGDYVIRLAVNGEMRLMGDTTYTRLLVKDSSSNADKNRVYTTAIKKVEIGGPNVLVADQAFSGCDGLIAVSVPNSIKEFRNNPFRIVKNLDYVTVPYGVETLSYLGYSSNIRRVSLPEGLKTMSSAFQNCSALFDLKIPDTVTLGYQALSGCNSLGEIYVPQSTTTVGSGTFDSCKSLSNIVFNGNITSVDNGFYGCYGLAFVDFTACKAVPTLASANYINTSCIPEDCEIRVPAALYDEWIAATNWATRADNIKAY